MKNSTLDVVHSPRRRRWMMLLGGVLISLFVSTAGLTIVPAAFPALGANMADFLRTMVGPQPVARLESLSFALHDNLNRALSTDNGGKPQIGWSNPNQPGESTSHNTQEPALTGPINPLLVHNRVVTAPPQIGWQGYGPTVNGSSAMARAMIMLDPQRSYAGVALVRIDLSKLQLHMMPGYLEPSHPSGISQVIPGLGSVPPQDQSNLIAAFNGGFKGIHGHYGMMVNGVTLLPPIPNIATVAIYRDGHVQIGGWGKGILPSADIVAFRQNCPPLVEDGQLNPDLSLNNHLAWGYTGNTDITWRTGLGITQDGRYLIYAVGNGTSAETLAKSLLTAGAYNAMQLDINEYYAHFYTYQSASQGSQMNEEQLLTQMTHSPHLYLTSSPRDFFYLTIR